MTNQKKIEVSLFSLFIEKFRGGFLRFFTFRIWWILSAAELRLGFQKDGFSLEKDISTFACRGHPILHATEVCNGVRENPQNAKKYQFELSSDEPAALREDQ